MLFTTLDIICRKTLFDNGLPIHFYAEYLSHSSTCLRELTIDTLQVINTRNLPVDSYGAVNLPDDYLDDVMMSFIDGQLLSAIPHKFNINPLRIHNATTGAFNLQPDIAGVDITGAYFPFVGRTWYWNVSDYGEPTGRMFGETGGNPNGYAVVKERRQIQIYGATGGNVILQYISDGQSVDNASMVDTMAFSTFQAFINWKTSPNKNNEFSPEALAYYNTKRKLRGRLNPLTMEDIKNIFRGGYTASIKN